MNLSVKLTAATQSFDRNMSSGIALILGSVPMDLMTYEFTSDTELILTGYAPIACWVCNMIGRLGIGVIVELQENELPTIGDLVAQGKLPD